MSKNAFIYIIVMAAVTYLIRVLPLTLIRKEIKNPFIRSFLFYVPYVTASVWSAAAALVVAVFLAYRGKSLFQVSLAACAVVFLTELVLPLA